MTCIVGYKDLTTGDVWVGGDSAASTPMEVMIMETPKVFRAGSLVIGCAGSIVAINALRYGLQQIESEREDFTLSPSVDSLDQYMTLVFPRFARKVFKRARELTDGYNYPFGAVVGIHDRLYSVESNLQWEVPASRIAATGSGMSIAMGALDILTQLEGLAPTEIVSRALDSSARLTPYVRPPFHLMSTISGQHIVME